MPPATLGLPPSASPTTRTRLELEILAIQCSIVLFYSAGVLTGLFNFSDHYLAPALIWIVGYHVFRVIYVLRFPVKRAIEALTPFLDVSSITTGLLVLHDVDSPLWAIYLIALVGYARRRGGFYFALVALFIIANLVVSRWAIAATDGRAVFDGDMISIIVIAVGMAVMADVVSHGWREAEQRARHHAETDPLTGVGNRRAFRTELERYSRRPDVPCAILMLDIDNLKRLNDEYGHVLGDDVLEHVATILASNLRSGDRLARYGGDEFIISMPGTGADEAAGVAERLRHLVEQETRATVSIGCTARQDGEDIESVLRRADALLLAAKRSGKNRIRSETIPRSA